jgi:hypothetical protein
MSGDEMPDGVPGRKRGDLSLPAVLVGFVLMWGIGGAVWYFMAQSEPDLSRHPKGRVVGEGFSMEAASCTTGPRKDIEFADPHRLPLGGVRIVGRNGGAMFVHREGKHVVVEPPRCTTDDCRLRLEQRHCSVFHVEIGWTGNVHNNRNIWGGRVRLKCEIDGKPLRAEIAFPSC